jgi:hypothetical protein
MTLAWTIAPACGLNFPHVLLQQDLQDQLQVVPIAVSRVHTASLVAAIDCQPAAGTIVLVRQCLSLSQAISEPSADNGLHLATTWRNCRSYTCGRQTCGEVAHATQRTLIDQFLPAFRTLSATSETPPPTPAAQPRSEEGIASAIVYPDASNPILMLNVVFYILYVVICIGVLFRWERCR